MKSANRITVITCLILACSFAAYAQSGRRQTKPAPAAPIPSPTPEPTPKPKTEAKEPELFFFVGADRNRSYSFYPNSYYDAVLSGCSEVLRRYSSAQVDVTVRELSRGEAIKKAKDSANTYTVLLELQEDAMSRSPGNSQYDQIQLEYVVFAPGTAKIVTSGRTYQNASRKGPVVVGPTGGGSTSGLYREVLLKRAGEEAGDRILRALHLIVPTTN